MKLRSTTCALLYPFILSFALAAFADETPTAAPSESHRIAVAPVGLADRPIVYSINDSVGFFGLASAIKQQLAASNELLAELSASGFDYRTYVPAQLDAALKTAHFEVVDLPGDRKGGDNFRFLSHPSSTADTDVLDVYVGYLGYWAPDTHTPFRPLVKVSARLSRAGSNVVLLETKINCGQFAPSDVVTFTGDPRFSFANREAMKAAPADVTAGLRSAIDIAFTELARQVQAKY